MNILLVEDNPGDVTFFRETLRDVLLPTALPVVEKGDEVLAYLRTFPRKRGSAEAGAA